MIIFYSRNLFTECKNTKQEKKEEEEKEEKEEEEEVKLKKKPWRALIWRGGG